MSDREGERRKANMKRRGNKIQPEKKKKSSTRFVRTAEDKSPQERTLNVISRKSLLRTFKLVMKMTEIKTDASL